MSGCEAGTEDRLAQRPGAGAAPLLGSSLGELLDELGSEERVPAGGSSAALTVAVAAALVAKVARLSRPDWAEAAGAAAQAAALRRRALMLAEADAAVYEDALRALERKGVEPGLRPGDPALGEALSRAADIPLLIATAACDVGALAADVAGSGRPDASADAVVAALLAEGCARSAHQLVEVNLATRPGDERVAEGVRAVEIARAAARRATAAAAA